MNAVVPINSLPETGKIICNGFIRNRFIGDNTRLTYDLIHLLNKTNRTALFLSLDIQDAFNSVNWGFIRIILRKLHFPQFCIQWFDTLCFEAASLIVYNGHISKRIRLERSCRQGDPLSPYIFVLVMSALLERIKQNRRISGVKVGDFEFKGRVSPSEIGSQTFSSRPWVNKIFFKLSVAGLRRRKCPKITRF